MKKILFLILLFSNFFLSSYAQNAENIEAELKELYLNHPNYSTQDLSKKFGYPYYKNQNHYNFAKKKLLEKNTNLDNLTYFLTNIVFDKPVSTEIEILFNKGYFSEENITLYRGIERNISYIETALEDDYSNLVEKVHSNSEISAKDKKSIITDWFSGDKKDRRKIERILNSKLVPDKNKEKYIGIKLVKFKSSLPIPLLNVLYFPIDAIDWASWSMKSMYLRGKYILDR